jgi:hypothetical protein
VWDANALPTGTERGMLAGIETLLIALQKALRRCDREFKFVRRHDQRVALLTPGRRGARAFLRSQNTGATNVDRHTHCSFPGAQPVILPAFGIVPFRRTEGDVKADRVDLRDPG